MIGSMLSLFCAVTLGCALLACGGKNKDKGTKLMKPEKGEENAYQQALQSGSLNG